MTPLSHEATKSDRSTALRTLAVLAAGFALTLIVVQLVVVGAVSYPPSRLITDGTAILVQALLVMLLARKVWR